MLRRVKRPIDAILKNGGSVEVEMDTRIASYGPNVTAERVPNGHNARIFVRGGEVLEGHGWTAEDALANALGVEPRKRARKGESC
jgi:hypothetical protein